MAATEQVKIELVIDGQKVAPTMREMQSEVNKLNKELKDLPVGSDAFIKKSAELKLVQDRYNGVRTSTAEARVEGTKLLDSIRQLGPGGQIIGNVADKFNGVKTSAAGSVGGINAMGFAMKAAFGVIGLVVIAITSLIQYFKLTDEGATRLEGIMKGLDLVFRQLIQPVISLGKAIFDNPMKVLKDLGNFIKDQFINRLTSIITAFDAVKLAIGGDFKAAATKAQDAYLQFTLGITDGTAKLKKAGEDIKAFGGKLADAAKEGDALAKAFDDLSDRERGFSNEAKNTENQIKELLLQAKNRATSEEKRQELLEQADQLETGLHQKQVGFENERLSLIQREILAENGIIVAKGTKQSVIDAEIKKLAESGRATDEQLQKEVDAKNKIAELDGKSIEMREKIQNKQDALDLAQDAKNKKKADDKQKELDDEEKALQQELDLAADFDAALLKQETDAKTARLDLISTEEAEAKLAIEQKFFGQIEAQKAYEEELYQVEKAGKEKRLAEITGNGTKERAERAKLQSEILKGESDRAKREIENETKTNQLKQSLRDTNINLARQSLQLGIQFLSQDEENRKKYGNAIKALAIADIGINLAKSLSSIFAASMQNPTNGITFGAAGTAQYAIQAGIAIGQAALQTNSVINQKFGSGGISPRSRNAIMRGMGGVAIGSRHGSRYGEAGIAMIDRVSGQEVGEFEGGEPILTRGVAQNPYLLAAASRINVLGGGRAFAEAGGITPGGSTQSFNFDNSEMVNEVRALRTEITTWQRELVVVQNITSLYKKQAEYEKMVETVNI